MQIQPSVVGMITRLSGPLLENAARVVPMEYRAVVERDREEIEILLRDGETQGITDALLSAAFYDPEWRWVQGQCLAFSHHSDRNVRWISATCLGHLARIHRQLDLELVLPRLVEMRADSLLSSAAEDALEDIRFFMKFQ
jgi:hypothetical protein